MFSFDLETLKQKALKEATQIQLQRLEKRAAWFRMRLEDTGCGPILHAVTEALLDMTITDANILRDELDELKK